MVCNLIEDVILKGRQWGLDWVFKYEEFVLVRDEAEDYNEYLKTRFSPNQRSLNESSESMSVLAQWIIVLGMSVWMNKLIVWNYTLSLRPLTIISSPRTVKKQFKSSANTSMVFQVCSRGAIRRV